MFGRLTTDHFPPGQPFVFSPFSRDVTTIELTTDVAWAMLLGSLRESELGWVYTSSIFRMLLLYQKFRDAVDDRRFGLKAEN